MDHGIAAHGAHHIKAIHDVLGIKPDQEAAFQAYADALRAPRQGSDAHGPGVDSQRLPDHGAMASLTTPQRLDLMGKMMDEHHEIMRARFERVASATKALYADLTPEQKRIMDALPELTDGMRHGGMGHGEGHMRSMPGAAASTGAPPTGD